MNLGHRIRKTDAGIYVIDGDSHITKWTEEQGRLQTDPTVGRLLEYIPYGGVVVDAGGSIGDHTHSYAVKAGERGTVFAFEPNPAPFCCLTMNCRELPQVIPFRVGLSDTFGQYQFAIDEQNLGASSANSFGADKILTLPLDDMTDWFMRLGRFDYFKLDIEGMELRALLGAANLIRYFKPIIFCEVNDGTMTAHDYTRDELFQVIRGFGYHIENFELGHSHEFSRTQFDILCTPK